MEVLMLLVPIIAGKLTELLTNLLKMVGGWLASAPAWAKQATALVVACVLAYMAALVDAPQIVGGDPGTIVNALLAWMIAMLFHNGKKLSSVR